MNSASFSYRNAALYAEDVALADIAAEYGTPCYVYSRRAIENAYRAYDEAFASHDHLICYAVKANSNIGVLNLLARLGAGFDIVSGGELRRVIEAGGDTGKVVFSGVAKSRDEIRFALEAGIYCFNVESEAELERIQAVATECDRRARISLRVNPDVDAQTHPYISTGLRENKFGVAIDDAAHIYRRAMTMSHIDVHGVDCHIGSQLTTLAPFTDALDRVLLLVDSLAAEGIELSHIDVGGGLGVRYNDELPPTQAAYAEALLSKLGNRAIKVLVEPGRSIAANAGVMLTSVEYLKSNEDRHFALVDAAMNDLIRPSLYGAWMDIVAVRQRDDVRSQCYDVVGPVCETGDFLGKQRDLAIEAGDLLAVCDAGAYGFVMASNYNTRARPAEIIVDGENVHVVREREQFADLIRGEHRLPEA